jgi:hypothetical protein
LDGLQSVRNDSFFSQKSCHFRSISEKLYGAISEISMASSGKTTKNLHKLYTKHGNLESRFFIVICSGAGPRYCGASRSIIRGRQGKYHLRGTLVFELNMALRPLS